MAKKTNSSSEYRPVNRWAIIGMGALLGVMLGSLMWVVTGLHGGWRVWLYLALTTAMLGVGISAAFGASAVRKRGERVGPKLRKR